MIVFVCSANVWRSQVAEWFAKKFWLDAISCAGVEAKKEKYGYKPDKVITDILLKNYDIDISNQEIFYPEDIKDKLLNAEKIMFLFDPDKVKKVDNKVLVDGMTLWEFLKKNWKKYKKNSIPDPYEKWNFEKKVVIDKIYNLIKTELWWIN